VRARIVAAMMLALTGAQAIRFERSSPPVKSDLAAPPAVDSALRQACYDCHSNETRWPWYTAVAPASWLAHYDVVEGRRRLNFSDWRAYAYDPGTRLQKLDEIRRLVLSGEMPPWYYRALRSDTHWTEAQREDVLRWTAAEIAAQPRMP